MLVVQDLYLWMQRKTVKVMYDVVAPSQSVVYRSEGNDCTNTISLKIKIKIKNPN